MMSSETVTARWFAVQVRTRWESSTALLLSGKGYESFLPTYKTKKRWSGNVKEVNAPLFPGYVFCHFEAQKRLPILVTPGVIAVVGRGRTPVPVEDSEIASLQTAIRSRLLAEPWPYLEIGERIRIEDEAFHGLEGVLVNFKGSHRIVVSVSLLRRSVALEIDRSLVRPTAPQRKNGMGSVATPSLLDGVIA
jgi:transcription antitermination factor NusG